MKAKTRIWAARSFIHGDSVSTIARMLHSRRLNAEGTDTPCGNMECACPLLAETTRVEHAIRFTLLNVKAAVAEGRFVARKTEGAAP